MTATDESTIRQQFQAGYFLIGGISYSSNVVLSAAQLLSCAGGPRFAIYLLFSGTHQHQLLAWWMPTWPSPQFSGTPRAGNAGIRIFQVYRRADCTGCSILIIHPIAMMIFGMPYATLVSLIVFVMAFIPIFGPYISGAIGTLLIFTVAPGKALWFLLMFFVVQQLEGSLVYPRIMSSAVDMPSIWILVAVTLGGGILGIVGMCIFIPLAAVGYRILGEETSQRESARTKTQPRRYPDGAD